MDIWTIILTVSAVLIALHYSLKRKNFLEKHDIIHTRKLPLIGHMGQVMIRRMSVPDMVKKMYNIHTEAKYVGFYDFTVPIVVLRDPDLIRSVAIKNFDHFVDRRALVDPQQEPLFGNNLAGLRGHRWREMRNLLTPAFTSSKMKAMFKLMRECGERFVDYLADETRKAPIMYNSKDLFTRYTVDVIATCAFGIEVDSLKNPDNDFYVLGKKSTIFEGFALFKLFLMRAAPALTKILGIHLLDKKIERFFTQLVEETIETRDREGIHRPDMIQLMMESRNNKSGTGPTLSIHDMTSQAFVFFFGGFDTTSTSMCFVVHHIASDPVLQRKLQAEVDEAYEKCNHKLTYEVINEMPYLDAIVNECMRIYTIGVALDRICTRKFELPPALPGKKPVLLEPGDSVWIPVYALHMDPQYFDDPEKFYPERFIENPQKSLHSPVYFPFGVGPRMCIGNRFALLEIKVLIFHLVLKCSLKIAEKMIMPMRISKSSGTFMPEGGFWVTLEPRIITAL